MECACASSTCRTAKSKFWSFLILPVETCQYFSLRRSPDTEKSPFFGPLSTCLRTRPKLDKKKNFPQPQGSKYVIGSCETEKTIILIEDDGWLVNKCRRPTIMVLLGLEWVLCESSGGVAGSALCEGMGQYFSQSKS